MNPQIIDIMVLRACGYIQSDIAKELGCSQANISETLKRIRRDSENYQVGIVLIRK